MLQHIDERPISSRDADVETTTLEPEGSLRAPDPDRTTGFRHETALSDARLAYHCNQPGLPVWT